MNKLKTKLYFCNGKLYTKEIPKEVEHKAEHRKENKFESYSKMLKGRS